MFLYSFKHSWVTIFFIFFTQIKNDACFRVFLKLTNVQAPCLAKCHSQVQSHSRDRRDNWRVHRPPEMVHLWLYALGHTSISTRSLEMFFKLSGCDVEKKIRPRRAPASPSRCRDKTRASARRGVQPQRAAGWNVAGFNVHMCHGLHAERGANVRSGDSCSAALKLTSSVGEAIA